MSYTGLIPIMRHLLLLILFVSSSALVAQDVSGRTFRRTARTPETPAASKATEAATSTRTVRAVKKLRSGRPWPKHHYSRLPRAKADAKPAAKPVDATTTRTAKKGTRRFWGPRRK